MQELTVTMTAIEELVDHACFVAVLYEHPDGSGERLEMQRGLSFDARDRRLGQDTYCLSLASGATHDGGVESYRLTGDILQMRLTRKGADVLGLDRDLRFVLRIDDAKKRELKAAMKRIFVELHRARR